MEAETDPDEWDLESDLGEVERLVGPLETPASSAPAAVFHRVDGAAENAAGPRKRRRKRKTLVRRAPFVSWALVAVGLMGFAFGAGLVVWSLVTGRGELWNIGMPITVAAQGALLIGLVLQLDGLWQSNRSLAKSLENVYDHVDQLEQTTETLATQNGSQSFYDHLSSGASPHLLLADLKGQMDLLSQQVK